MRILSDKELVFVEQLDAPGRFKLEVSFHEAGHALTALLYGGTFGKIVCDISNRKEPGYLTDLTMPDRHTKRQAAGVALGGWAATQILCDPVRIDLFTGRQFKDDLQEARNILRLPSEKAEISKTAAQVINLMGQNVGKLKRLAFAVMEKGSIDYSEAIKLTAA